MRFRGARQAVANAIAGTGILLAAGAAGCGDEPHDFDGRPSLRAALSDAGPSLRAAVIVEPEILRIGERVTVELAVVTPPNHRVHPIERLEVPGLWLLGVRSLPVETTGARWLHRTQFRLRARKVGRHAWPAMRLKIEKPNGDLESLPVEARPLEVESVRPRFPGREEPFGVEQPVEADSDRARFLTGLLAGLGLAASMLAGGFAVRRVLRRSSDRPHSAPDPAEEPATSLRQWSLRELGNAVDSVDANPRSAANAGARLLRVYMGRRFGSATEAATTEELEHHLPVLSERTAWPEFVRILHGFDDLRFPPDARPEPPRQDETQLEANSHERLRIALEDCRRLIDSSLPRAPNGRRQ